MKKEIINICNKLMRRKRLRSIWRLSAEAAALALQKKGGETGDEGTEAGSLLDGGVLDLERSSWDRAVLSGLRLGRSGVGTAWGRAGSLAGARSLAGGRSRRQDGGRDDRNGDLSARGAGCKSLAGDNNLSRLRRQSAGEEGGDVGERGWWRSHGRLVLDRSASWRAERSGGIVHHSGRVGRGNWLARWSGDWDDWLGDGARAVSDGQRLAAGDRVGLGADGDLRWGRAEGRVEIGREGGVRREV